MVLDLAELDLGASVCIELEIHELEREFVGEVLVIQNLLKNWKTCASSSCVCGRNSLHRQRALVKIFS